MKNFCRIVLLGLLFLGFNIEAKNMQDRPLLKEKYRKIMHNMMENFQKEVCSNYPLFVMGTGGGMLYSIEMTHFMFGSYEPKTIEGARNLYLELMEKWLEKVNSNEEVRPHLENYPFTYENVELELAFFEKHPYVFASGDLVGSLSCINGLIHYSTDNPETDLLLLLHKEPYEEAVKLWRAGKEANQDTN